MSNTIIFVHGMFQNPKSWESWQRFFEERGYTTQAPAWAFHDGEPAALRQKIPEGLGKLRLGSIIEQHAKLVNALGEKPIVIGHSVGGLIAQVLASRDLVRASVCIDSVAPNRMLAFDWGFLKNSAAIANPVAGDDPYLMTPEGFHANFANTMSAEESNAAYERFATHDSRNVLRDCMGDAGKIDLERAHPPLLFIAGEKDQIIPPELNEKNAKAYSDKSGVVGYSEFANRGHFICGQPRWEEVAAFVTQWLRQTLGLDAGISTSASV
jgi:pimeloyl-ACP methyl ester carboxylesterase